MKVTALNEQQRKKIVKSVKPKRDDPFVKIPVNKRMLICIACGNGSFDGNMRSSKRRHVYVK